MKIGPYVNLGGANLGSADLGGANLCGADLRAANLRGANLCSANLCGADLRAVDLRDVDLSYADLSYTDLSYADLRGANLRDANLRDAKLYDAKLYPFQIPQEGSLIVYKKLKNESIAKLKVLEDSKRTASLIGRKCRAESVKVLEIRDSKGDTLDIGYSEYSYTFIYKVGETVTEPNYDSDIRVDCTQGIHFFLTREEAENY